MNRAKLRTILSVGILALVALTLTGQKVRGQEDQAQPTPPSEHAAAPAEKAHAAGGHHDETDVSHANAGPDLNAPEEFKSDLAIYTFVIFLLLAAVLLKFAWRPIVQGLEKREQSIANLIAEARESAHKADESLKQYQAKLLAAQEETREMMMRSRQDAEGLKDRIVAELQSAAQREREKAVADIQAAKNAALQEIAQQSVSTAVGLAGRIIRREVRPQDHAALIRESLEKLPGSN